jgi:hypothetical protein
MLEEILKNKLEKDLNADVTVTEETIKTEGSNFADFMKQGKTDEVIEEKKEVTEKEVVKEETIKEVVNDTNKNINTDGVDMFDFRTEKVENKTEEKIEEKSVVEFDLNSKFKEQFPDVEIQDVAQLVSEYKELKDKKPLLDDEQLSKVAGLLVDGELDWNKIKEIAEVKTLNVDNLSEREVFIRGLKKEGYSADDIKDELEIFDSAFNFDEDMADSRDLIENKRLKSSLKRKIKDYKEDLNRLKDDAQFDLPKISLKADNSKSMEEEIKKQEEMLSKWNNAVKSNISDFKEVVFNLDKDKNYNFKVAEDDLNFLEKTITDSAEIYKQYQDKENNTFDFKSLRQDLFMMKNWKTVVKTLIQQNANNKAEEVIKEISNIDMDGSQKGTGGKAPNPRDLGIKAILGL